MGRGGVGDRGRPADSLPLTHRFTRYTQDIRNKFIRLLFLTMGIMPGQRGEGQGTEGKGGPGRAREGSGLLEGRGG